jgi:hypothetical protein
MKKRIAAEKIRGWFGENGWNEKVKPGNKLDQLDLHFEKLSRRAAGEKHM